MLSVCTCIKQEFNFTLSLSLRLSCFHSLSSVFSFLFCTFVWSRSLFSYPSTDEMLKQQTHNLLYSINNSGGSSSSHRSFSFPFTRIYYLTYHKCISACVSVRMVVYYMKYISVQIWCAFWGILYCFLFYFSLKLFKWMGENEAITTYSHNTTQYTNIEYTYINKTVRLPANHATTLKYTNTQTLVHTC